MTYLVGVFPVHPSHLEHVFDLLRKADTGPTVGSEVDFGDALCPGHLGCPQVQKVFSKAKGSYPEGDVIADEDNVAPFWVLKGLKPHFEGHHAHLARTRMHKKTGLFLQEELIYLSLAALHSMQDLSTPTRD